MKKKITVKTILISLFGIFLVSMGVAFNNCAGLGNDSVGIVYDGIRSITGMNAEQLGMASNVVNVALIVLLFLLARRYISVGTFVYIIPYGTFVKVGTMIYHAVFTSDGMTVKSVASVLGCLLLYFGVAIYITLDIGVDPFTGIVLFLRDVTKKQYRYVKIGFDICMIILGTVLGGKLGVVTFVTALTAGPVIQFFSEQLKKSEWLMRGVEIEKNA